MGSVTMKATQIRDRWMEILGFKKKINPLTGEIYFEYQGLWTTIKNLVKGFSDLSAKGKLLVGLGLGVAITKLYTAFKKLSTVMGVGGLLQSSKELFNWAKLGVQVNGNLNKGLIDGIEAWRKQKGIIGENTTAFSRLTSGTKEFVKGLGVAATGFTVMNIGLDSMKEKGLSAFNSITTLGGGLATVFGGVQAGAVFGPWGAAIGGIVSSIGVLYQTIDGLGYAFDESKRKSYALHKEVQSAYDEWQKSAENLRETLGESDSTFGYYERLYTELTNIVDENGKIKKGYEDRATFITGELSKALGIEINVVDGVIQKYGKLKKSIADLIEQKKAMAKINALEEEFNKAIAGRDKAEQRKLDTYEKLKSAYKELNDTFNVKGLGLSNEELSRYLVYGEKSANIQKLFNENNKEAIKSLTGIKSIYNTGFLKEAIEDYESATNLLDGYNSTISTWEKVSTMAIKGNYKDINEYFDHEQYLIGRSTTERETYWNNIITKNQKFLEMLEKDRNNYTEQEYKAKKKQYEDEIKLGQDHINKLKLVNQTGNKEISDETIKAWRDMGNKSTEEFLYYFDQLPTDAKQSLIDGLEKNKKDLSKNLQKIINEIKPTLTIDVKGNMSPFEQNVRNLASKYKNLLPAGVVDRLLDSYFKTKANGGVFNGTTWSNIPQFANGGMPSHGTLFAAGENGAEIVGNINRRTEVLNRSQIASAIYSAVASAMSQYGGGTTQVELIAHTDEGVVIDRINQKTKQTGRCPIDMPAY